jgi:hypothetical protein
MKYVGCTTSAFVRTVPVIAVDGAAASDTLFSPRHSVVLTGDAGIT